MTPQDRFVDIGFNLHLREWPGPKTPFVLLHGLSSNSRTWDAVGDALAQAGHRVIAVDQRGHGLSDKPDSGYGFDQVTADLARLLASLALEQPILVGQSWGGNVVLEFGARYPAAACGLVFVDGGFLDLHSRPDASWEKISVELKPPPLAGMPRTELAARIRDFHPDWAEFGIEATLANFETLPDGTIRPWLSLDRHLAILRAMWEQRPAALFPQIIAPTLICVAEVPGNARWPELKAKQVAAAQAGLSQAAVHWFENTDHDIHVHRPGALVQLLLDTLQNGFWAGCAHQTNSG
ncbi:MAG: 2-succinyl-6-hydroxy-2,4-cyclohexadiene-1-carboxylate synthase [Anaerolineae bacterium]|nr:2-succinyl-6-hydroxy-2,4-cyclohexadiene-1-carboxylate synthase [Anaerolineae bacterium]